MTGPCVLLLQSLEWDHNGSEKSLDTVGSMFDDFEVQVVDPVRQGEGVGVRLVSDWHVLRLCSITLPHAMKVDHLQ